MRIQKSVFKNPLSPPIQCCEPIKQLDTSFAHCFSILLRGGRGQKYEIVQIAVFPIIFVTDCRLDFQNSIRATKHCCALKHFYKPNWYLKNFAQSDFSFFEIFFSFFEIFFIFRVKYLHNFGRFEITTKCRFINTFIDIFMEYI